MLRVGFVLLGMLRVVKNKGGQMEIYEQIMKDLTQIGLFSTIIIIGITIGAIVYFG